MPLLSSTVHGISLGSLVFVANGANVVYTEPSGTGETYTFNVLAPDATWGNPQPVTETLVSLMTNGSQVVHVRDDNREPALTLTIEASGPTALAAAETALLAVVGEPVELRYQPPSVSSAVTVFDVVWSQLEHKLDSVDERYLRRTYSLQLQALPYARSASLTVTPAPSTTITTTTVDSGAATTNWTIGGPSGATLSVVSGAVRSTYNPATTLGAGLYGTTLRRTATVDTSVDKYISVDWKTSIPSVYGMQINAATGNLKELRREPGAVAGFTRSWFQVPSTVTTLAWFQFGIVHPASTGSATLEIDLVQKQNALPISGTTRQKLMSVIPGGSVPTEGTIHVSHATSALGQTVIFTHPIADGYAPPLRPWRSASDTVVTDSNMMSGAYQTLAGVSQFKIPVSAVPKGDVQLWARIANPGATAVTVNIFYGASAYIGSTPVGVDQTGSSAFTIPATSWMILPLARLTLPTAKMGPDGLVYIGIQRDVASSATIWLDEAWLFAMDRGRLTIVDCGITTPSPGGSSNHLWINAPSTTEPAGSLLVGNSALGSDAYWPPSSAVPSSQVHTFEPDGSFIFLASSNASDALVDLTHYRRWHTNAGS